MSIFLMATKRSTSVFCPAIQLTEWYLGTTFFAETHKTVKELP